MKTIIKSVLWCLIFGASLGSIAERPQPADTAGWNPNAGATRTDVKFGRMPLSFIPNEGQLDNSVIYYIAGRDTFIYFGPTGVSISLMRFATPEKAAPIFPKAAPLLMNKFDQKSRWTVKLDFIGVAAGVMPCGDEKTGSVTSYFRGRPDEWKSGLPSYSRIVYRNLWPGIDLAYSGSADCLKYEFVVQPGVDPSTIRLAYRGASRVAVNAGRQLEVDTPLGGFYDQAPLAYQDRNGDRVPVPVAFQVEESADPSAAFGFAVGAYDRSLPLVIDPATVIYCGFIGGAADDRATAVAVDGSGNAYLTGWTASFDFPVTAGPDLTFNDASGKSDAFVAKVTADGTALVYCGFIGGIAEDVGTGVAVDSAGNAYVSGRTFSSDFPVLVGPYLTHRPEISQYSDAFVTKVNAVGTSLVYSGFVGGSRSDQANAIAVDRSGCAYITGWTESGDFPVKSGPETSPKGGRDAFVTEVNAAGTSLVYSGYIGGSQADAGSGIAVDSSGYAYITGSTSSSSTDNFPVWVGSSYTYNGNQDAFVANVSPWARIGYCGYIGGAGVDSGVAIAVDSHGCAYVTGTSNSGSLFPVKGGPDLVHHGGNDAFVAKIFERGGNLYYCGFIGGSGDDRGKAIAVDFAGRAYIAGSTSSAADFPVTGGPFLVHAGLTDAFAATVGSTGESLLYCSYLGGSQDDEAAGVATDGSGNVFVAGYTRSADFPISLGAIPASGAAPSGTSDDAFIARISEDLPPCGPYLLGTGNVTTAEIEITWTDESTNETGFKIERQNNPPQEWVQIAMVDANVITYADTGLTEGWAYIYRVRAYNDFGDSEYSIPFLFFTRPEAATNLTATAVNERRIELSWVDNSNHEIVYHVERKVHAYGSWTILASRSYDATSYVDTNFVAEDTMYFYRVLALAHDYTESFPSNEASVTTPPLSLPIAPSGLQATAPLATQVTLTWLNNAFNAAGFKIERKTGAAGAWSQIGSTLIGSYAFVDRSAVENTTYFYRVCAYNGAGNSGYSDEVPLTTPANKSVLRLPIWDLSFGYVNVCTGVYETTFLYNDGDAPLVVNRVIWASGSSDFGYLGPPTPFSIAPGGSAEIRIGFLPSGGTGPVSAVFSILSNDPVNGSAPFTATGRGIALSVSAQLQVERGFVRAWIARMDYARINAEVTLSAPQSAVTFRLMRKAGSASYRGIKLFTWDDTVAGQWTYTDMFLESNVSYAYRIDALNCRGFVIYTSQGLDLVPSPQRQKLEKDPLRRIVKR